MSFSRHTPSPGLLERQRKRLAAAGLDTDISALDRGPTPEEWDLSRNPGRIRIRERQSTKSWEKWASCADDKYDTNLWFPTRQSTAKQVNEAKDICNNCAVRWDCLAYSIGNYEKIGIFGGYAEIQRREIRKMLNRAIKSGEVNPELPADNPASVRSWLEAMLEARLEPVVRGSAANSKPVAADSAHKPTRTSP